MTEPTPNHTRNQRPYRVLVSSTLDKSVTDQLDPKLFRLTTLRPWIPLHEQQNQFDLFIHSQPHLADSHGPNPADAATGRTPQLVVLSEQKAAELQVDGTFDEMARKESKQVPINSNMIVSPYVPGQRVYSLPNIQSYMPSHRQLSKNVEADLTVEDQYLLGQFADGCILLQLSPSFQFQQKNLENLVKITKKMPDYGFIFDVKGWDAKGLLKLQKLSGSGARNLIIRPSLNIDKLLDDQKVFALLSDLYPVSFTSRKGKILISLGKELKANELPGSVLNLGMAPSMQDIYKAIHSTRLVQGGTRHRNRHADRAIKMLHQHRFRQSRGGLDLNQLAMRAIEHEEWNHGSSYLASPAKFYDDKDLKIEGLLVIVAILMFLVAFFGRK